MRIFVDADACPAAVKDIVVRAAQRLAVSAIFVANKTIRLPASRHVSTVRVAMGLDVADGYIATSAEAGDLAITADEVPLRAPAALGDLDPTFGSGGKVLVHFSNYASAHGHSVLIQSTGKILLSGESNYGDVAARLNPDGSLDATFGTGGTLCGVAMALNASEETFGARAIPGRRADGFDVLKHSARRHFPQRGSQTRPLCLNPLRCPDYALPDTHVQWLLLISAIVAPHCQHTSCEVCKQSIQ